MAKPKKTTKKQSDKNLRNDEMLREDTIDAAMKEAGLDGFGEKGTPTEKAAKLEAYYLGLPEPVGHKGDWHLLHKIEDDGCGYTTTAEQPICVFCGYSDDDEPAKPSEEIGTSLAVREPDAVAVPNAIEGEMIDEDEPPSGIPGQSTEAEGTLEDLDATIRDIENSTREFERSERVSTGYQWDIGASIFKLYSRKLYVQRRKDGGGPLYNSWAQFVRSELKLANGSQMSVAYSYRLMGIATSFDREMACLLGPSKLQELLPAAEAQAKENNNALRLGRDPVALLPPLLEKARTLPVQELRSQVKAALPSDIQRGQASKSTAKATEAAKNKKAAKKAESDRVTVATQDGKTVLKFFTSEKAARDQDEKKVAKKFAVGCVAIEPAVNGVEIVYMLKSHQKQGFLLSIERRRI